MTFEEVLPALREGRRIRRKDIVWKNNYGFIFIKDSKIIFIKGSEIIFNIFDSNKYVLDKEDLNADDWEIYEEPLLTDEEKAFIKNVLSFVNNKEIKGIKLTYYPYCYLYFISFNVDSYKSLYIFEMCYQSENRTYFKNLELNKYYTLKELGLEE